MVYKLLMQVVSKLRYTINITNRLVEKKWFYINEWFSQCSPRRIPRDFFCCHGRHNEETKSVEFAFIAISLRLTRHNNCTTEPKPSATVGIFKNIFGIWHYFCYTCIYICNFFWKHLCCKRTESIKKYTPIECIGRCFCTGGPRR